MEKQVIITLGREFGSGGHKIAQRIAQELGITYYDRNIMDVTKEVQERVKSAVETMTGLKVEEIRIRVAAVDLQNRES